MSVVQTFMDHLRHGKFSKEFFQASLTNVQGMLSDGLSADILESLVDVILTSNLNVTYSTKLIDCLIPESGINNATVDRILFWIFSQHRKKPVSLINALLRWLVGVVEYGIVEKSNVDGYYELIWGILSNERLERMICHLLYILTRPEDVYRGRVMFVLKRHELNGKAQHTMGLLSLFKFYKPEYVPESVQIKNLRGTFKTLPRTLENHLKQAQDRLHNQNIALEKRNIECVWARPFVKQKIIPDAAYVHLGSDRYHEKKKKVIQCLDKITLLNCQQNLEIPSRVLTLLLNEGGIHLLATHNHDVHVRFSYVVYYLLHNVFIEQKVTLPQQECEHFLKQLVDLEDYIHQGIPAVSRFLNEYICTWDGVEYRDLIYRLLERITFKSYEELQVLVLEYLNTLFITGDLKEQCLIIRTLKTQISNTLYRNRKASNEDNPLTFLGLNLRDSLDANAVLPQLTEFVGKLCRKGLQMTNSHPLLLHACIDFYHVVAEVEDHDFSWSIIPRACVYRCLLGPSTSMLSRTGDLLLKYYQTYSEMKNRGQHKFYEKEISIIEEYSYDMYNCLVRDMALSKAHQGYIFENLPKNLLCNGDRTFSITSTVIMGSVIHLMKGNKESDIYEPVLVAFKSVFKGLCKYLDLLQDKVEN